MSANPLHQFQIHKVADLQFAGFDISLTNQSIWMLGTVLFLSAIMLWAIRKPALVPSRMQSLMELTIDFIRNLTKNTAGEEALKFLPIVATVFLFVVAMNVMGLFPGSYTSTSQMVITATMAIAIFIMVIGVGLYVQGWHFFKLFYPEGTPWWLAPLIIVLEIISFFARPFTLSLRLAANMMAGHIILKVFASFVIMLMLSLPVGLNLFAGVPLLVDIALTGMELVVALLQAYVFTILTCVYLNDALHGH